MAELSNFVNEIQTMIQTTEQVPEKSVKIMIVSTHVNQVNGYSKVVFNLIKQLASYPWIQIVHFGTQKMINADLGRTYPSRVKVIDATLLDKDKQPGFALAELPGVIQSEKPDVVFIYNDLSVICAYIENIRKSIERRSFKIWAYVDVTYTSPSSQLIDILNRDVERVFCFTKSWKESIKSQGITRPVDILPHAVDPTMFHVIPRDLARQQLGLPKDIFLFTSVNKNIPRKRLDLLVISFVKLMVRFPTKPIYCLIVADKGENGGFSLFEIFAREIKLQGGSVEIFGNRLMITSKDTCYRDEDINLLYNCGDVGISCAEGEGFGLCTFEQMSIGVPQIVPEINGYTEYCHTNNSITVKPSMRCYIPQAYHSVTGEAHLVDPDTVSKAMERYVFDDDLRKLHGKLGKEKTGEYTWEKVTGVLVKRLKTLQEEED
jgi:glycosyltransferase involved in cell wall biosynthesis